MERRRVALTFDVDLVDWVAKQNVDELNDVMPALLRALGEVGDVRATFFVRLDDGIARRFGRADHAFVHAAALWERVREAGHEVAWHHHAVAQAPAAGNAVADSAVATNSAIELPECDRDRLSEAVRRHSQTARDFDCSSARMGWGQHTNATLNQLAKDGWRVDSSAMPRPVYAWDPPLRDWSQTPTMPHLIAHTDTLPVCEAPRARGLWEVPMTMVPLATSTDTQPDLRRYVNPAYRRDVFATAIAQAPVTAPLVLLCHPYECVGGRNHPLYAFSMDAVRANLSLLTDQGARWMTIAEVVTEVESRRPVEIDAYAA